MTQCSDIVVPSCSSQLQLPHCLPEKSREKHHRRVLGRGKQQKSLKPLIRPSIMWNWCQTSVFFPPMETETRWVVTPAAAATHQLLQPEPVWLPDARWKYQSDQSGQRVVFSFTAFWKKVERGGEFILYLSAQYNDPQWSITVISVCPSNDLRSDNNNKLQVS